ncbi:MAG: fructosamine kinase family protein [Spirochaetia bacterium]
MIDDARSLDDAIEQIGGPGVRITGRSSVPGGCIANGARLDLSNGTRIFVKQSSALPEAMFGAEARGLRAMRCEDGPRVPRPLAVGAAGSEPFILMEWIDAGRPGPGFHERFGSMLARMHRSLTGDRFGFESDNFIGSTEQPNTWSDNWCEFFASHRIGFQARLARDRGRIDSRLSGSIDSIVNRIGSLLIEPEHRSLLHGDLWSGNYLCDKSGTPVLIDPAVYYGHPEADLAMTELFGGFPPAFYRAYRDETPLQPGYPGRRDLYNLYHMLNHLNIFGGSYLGSVRSIVTRYL